MATESLAELVRFAPDVYGFRWENHVAMFVVTNAGVILTDPIGQVNPRTPSLIKEAIRAVTEQPVKYVVYSHSAFDHSTGGAVFADTARFVGHRNTVEKIKAAKDPTTPAPDIVFDKKMTLTLGGKSVDLHPADLSPTDDYIVLHYPAGRLAMFVDLVQPNNIPFRTLLGHPERVVARLRWLEGVDFDTIVSGHATPQMTGTKQDVVEQRQYYQDLSDAIAAARAAHLADASPEMTTLVRSILHPKYGAWRRFDGDFLGLNIQGMIAWRAGKAPAAH